MKAKSGAERASAGKYFGAILLVAGTTIGVGLLGLPVSTGFSGFFPSIFLFVICWMFMLFTGFCFVDVNCSMSGNVNLITMAGRRLGPWGKAVGWIVYLLLLYSLMAAYISASAPLFSVAFKEIFSVNLPITASKFLLPILFGGFIYLGTRGVDVINRLLMGCLVLSYFLMIAILPTHIEVKLLEHVNWTPFMYAAPIVLTSFGYHIIIPSLTNYIGHNRKGLYMVILAGSLIALIVNILWQFLVLGVVPLTGPDGLALAWKNGVPITASLAKIVTSPYLKAGAYFFAFFAIITSFLGVSLSLADFLTDGLKLKKSWEGRLLAIVLTFVPPLIFVFTYQRGFLLALEYAGAFVAILLIFLPAAMAWTLKKPKFYKSAWGRIMLSLTIIFSFVIVAVNLMIRWGYFTGAFEKLAARS